MARPKKVIEGEATETDEKVTVGEKYGMEQVKIAYAGKTIALPKSEGDKSVVPKHFIAIGCLIVSYKMFELEKFRKKLLTAPAVTQEVMMDSWLYKRLKLLPKNDFRAEEFLPCMAALKEFLFRKDLKAQPKLIEFEAAKPKTD